MKPHAYTEDQLVEQPAMFDGFALLGWALAAPRDYPSEVVRNAKLWVDETGLFGRETTGEVVLVSRLRAALERLKSLLVLNWRQKAQARAQVLMTNNVP